MPKPLKYIVDQSGQKKYVLVPVKVWEDLNTNYQLLHNKLDIFKIIQKGLQEVKESKKSSNK
jgi:hypothetical protein